MACSQIIKQVVEESLRKGAIRMESYFVRIFAEYLKHVWIFSKHKEKTLNSLKGLSEMILRF